MNQFQLRIHSRAFVDLQDTIDYYNNQQEGLGKRFYNLFEHALEILKTNPFFQVRFDNIRSLPLHKFPYTIYFDINQHQDIINVYAVVHQAMNPEIILNRLKDINQ